MHLHKVFEPNMYVIACSFEARYIYPPSLHITMADLIEYHQKIMIRLAHVSQTLTDFTELAKLMSFQMCFLNNQLCISAFFMVF